MQKRSKFKRKTSFGHHQRDKDEEGLSPQPQQESLRRKQQKKEKERLKTILKIKRNQPSNPQVK